MDHFTVFIIASILGAIAGILIAIGSYRAGRERGYGEGLEEGRTASADDRRKAERRRARDAAEIAEVRRRLRLAQKLQEEGKTVVPDYNGNSPMRRAPSAAEIAEEIRRLRLAQKLEEEANR